jgi:lipopolysaccharide transport system permease protein
MSRSLSSDVSPWEPARQGVSGRVWVLLSLVVSFIQFASPVTLRAMLREWWQYRELLRNLVVRDLKVRYRNSALGFAWSLLNPLLMMIVFTVVFTVLTAPERIEPRVQSFPVYVLSGLLVWNFMADSITRAMVSITGNRDLLTKVYFPRELLPLSAVLGNLAHFLLALPVYFVFAIALGTPMTGHVATLPALIVLQLALLSGLALIVAAINVYFRDIESIVGVGLVAWFFLTPIVYVLERVPNREVLGLDIWRWVYILNPMATLVTGYRYAIVYGWPIWRLKHLLVTVVTAVVLVWIGLWLFRRFSSRFVEHI